jgi:membrane protein implicated in regulation of membrane protease activity
MRRATFALTWISLLAAVAAAIWLPREVTAAVFVVFVALFAVQVIFVRRRYVRTRDTSKADLMRAAACAWRVATSTA